MTFTEVDELADLAVELEDPSLVVVWDDPVNTMDYVTLCFRQVFGWPLEECRRKMLEVHNDGKSVVWAGPLAEAEAIATRIRSYQLWVSVER